MAGKRDARPGARNHRRKTELAALATTAMEPPADFQFRSDQERDYFCELLKSRAPDDWQQSDLRRVKIATESWWAAEIEREFIALEDTVLIDDKGKASLNPRCRAMDLALKQHDATLRGLGIARPNMKPETLAKRREDVEAARRGQEPHPLLTATRGPLSVIPGGRKDA